MAELDLDLVRHALDVARKSGFAEVDLSVGTSSFSAKLEPLPPKPKSKKKAAAGPTEPVIHEVKANLVGFLRSHAELGSVVAPGKSLAVVEALGLANDVESTVAGEVVEVLVEVGEPVQYGQVLLRVKPQ